MRRRVRKGEGRGGHSLVEFSLILPLLFLLIVNVVNFGAFMYAWITVANAARTGAQYMVMSGASATAPQEATAAQIQTLVKNDAATLPNAATLQVKVCTYNNWLGQGEYEPVSGGSGGGCTTGGLADPEPNSYVLATVDVKYTYQPLIQLWDFPKLGVHATLPPTTIHRIAAMRMIQ
jgi:Flp pilus assembly protein TadG